jgi:acid stress-induced BolA-like protein IbaG/YrbA
MVSLEEVEQRFKALDNMRVVQARGDGYHYELTVVSDRFVGQSRVVREQWVYAQLQDYITSGRLHALTMKTLTVSEWEKQHG